MDDHAIWSFWAAARGWSYYPIWETMRYTFRGGGLTVGAPRYVSHGWTGRFGGLPCLGFSAGPGNAFLGPLHVVGVRLPGITFPDLTLTPIRYGAPVPGLPIDPVFDLSWSVTSASPGFARDVVGPAMQAYLGTAHTDFHQIWFERDAILLSRRTGIDPTQIDSFLLLLRALVDQIPAEVRSRLEAQGQPPQHTPRPAYQVVAPAPRPAPGDEWRLWAEERRWVYHANARTIVERFHNGPVPASTNGQFASGFAGRFGDLPCFGWKWVTAGEEGERTRHVVCLRRPGMSLTPVRVTREDPLLAELVGHGDIEVGSPGFDGRWRVTSESPEFAKQLLGPALWRRFEAPDLPPLGQVWFERDVVAVISESPIRPSDVDGYLLFLHGVLADMDS